MHFKQIITSILAVLISALVTPAPRQIQPETKTSAITNALIPSSAPLPVCNCSITQSGNTYAISSLLGNESAVLFYDYGNPAGSSANTGLELSNALILFLYEDINTGIISLFLIADIANSGSGGSLTFEFNCAPANSFISVQDDAGEFSGAPPLFTGNWNWGSCCTDGGVIENIGCNSMMSLDLLVSSGIDSIVWLTGDIANPDHILLDLSGEAITIDCGGSGVCCPVGLDTEVNIVDATCDDSPNGSINLNPQDGLPPYSYNWSNGETTSSNTNLLPGSYMVTVTDVQGCSEELQMTVDVSPGDPPAQSAILSLCSPDMEDVFDLTSLENTINLGSGFNVLWFENPDMTGSIPNPSNYFSGSTTVYAAVDNGPCVSDVVPVTLIIVPQPEAHEASITLCEEDNGHATFDLTTIENIVNTGAGDIMWYLNANLTNPIPDPSSFYTNSQTVYAVIEDGMCISDAVEIELIVDPKPEGQSTESHLCADEFDQAIFDLTALETEVGDGNGTVEWYLEVELLDLIPNPSFFQTTTTTVFAVVFDGVCYSDPIPVELIVEPTPTGNPITIQNCDDGSGMAVFILTDFDAQVSGGSGGVDWYLDTDLLDPVPNPDAFLTFPTIVYAAIDNGTCISDPVPVQLDVVISPVGISASLETCADSSGQGIFNLVSLDNIVNGGLGTVLWYEDVLGFDPITQPGAYTSLGGIVYAQINYAGCLSQFVPVDLIIVNSVSASPAQMAICDDGTGTALFNLLIIENDVSNGTGQVNWFLDPAGTQPIPFPGMFISGGSVVYARVIAGTCVSEIVPVQLDILPTPVAVGIALNVCGDINGQLVFDLTSLDLIVSAGIGNVTWYGDPLLNMLIPDPAVFLTGDTSIYATVSNGLCTSSPAEISISVSSELTANPVSETYCIPEGDTLHMDLTQFNVTIGGGSTTVHWFTDPLGMSEIINTNLFSMTTSQTLYVYITDGVCVSEIVPADFIIVAMPVANPLLIEKCGDINGQATLDLTSYDSIISGNTGSVTWYINSLLFIEVIGKQNYVTGDKVLYATVTNGPCVSSGVPITISIVDNLSINPVNVQVCVTDDDTAIIDLTLHDFEISGGNGDVFWFYDSDGLDTIFNPDTYSTDGSTIYAMVSADGCISSLAAIPVEISISTTPVPNCVFSSIDSVSFNWLGDADQYEISFFINGSIAGGPFNSSATEFSLGGLSPNDTVELTVTAVYNSICTTDLTNVITCTTEECPPATISIQNPGLICWDEDPFMLEVVVAGLSGSPQIVWSGPGIIDPSGLFDPALVQPGDNIIRVRVSNGECSYNDSTNLAVALEQIDSFVIVGSPCVDSTLELLFNGVGFGTADWKWNFGGANATEIDRPVDFYLQWDTPGEYVLSLVIDYNGCITDTFEYPVTIGSIPDPFVITCKEEDYYSLTVEWEPVQGTTSYIGYSSLGTGTLSGTTYTIPNLPDDTDVDITIEAIGDSDCGNSIASIQCRTLKFIPTSIYIPDIFSPNDDGINDVFYIHANSQVTEIHAMRIFDRWGDMVFEALEFAPNDQQYGWGGTFSEKPMNPGVYLYWVELETIGGEVIRMVGDLTLMR